MPSDTFAAGIEAAARVAESWIDPIDADTYAFQRIAAAIRALTPTASEATAIGAGDQRRLSMARDQLTSALNLRGSGVPAGRWGWAMDHGVWLLKLAEQTLSASPKVASDTAPGVREALNALDRFIVDHSGNDDTCDGMIVDRRAQEAILTLRAALAASPTASDTDTAIPGGGGLNERALHWRLMGLAATLRSEEFDEDNSSALDVEEAARRLTASPKPDTDTPVDPGVEGERDKLIEHLRQEFGDSYDCQRVWSAWGGGTMDADDFISLNDRVEEIADGILAALAAKPIAGVDAGES